MRKYLLLICIVCLCFTACMPATLSEKQEQDSKKEDNLVNYTNIDDMDFSSGHISGILRENFVVEAEVPVKYPSECGRYEINEKSLSMTETEYYELFCRLINEYYGEDIATSFDYILGGNKVLSCNYNGVEGHFQKGKFDSYTSYHQKISHLLCYVTEDGLEYDKEMIDGVVQEFLAHFKEVLPDGINGKYDCVHIDEEFYQYLIDKYDDTELSWGWIKDEKEYYAISIYSEIEDDTFLKIRHPKTYEVKAGEKADECGEIITSGNITRLHSGKAQFVELIVSEEGKVESIRIEGYQDIGKMIESKKILSPKDVLAKFYECYDGLLLENEILVKSIELEYMTVVADEMNDESVRNIYLEPVWRVRFDNGRPNEGMFDDNYVFSAVDGSLLLGVDAGY